MLIENSDGVTNSPQWIPMLTATPKQSHGQWSLSLHWVPATAPLGLLLLMMTTTTTINGDHQLPQLSSLPSPLALLLPYIHNNQPTGK